MKEIKPIFVIPMAGKGQRFKDQGILKPKFLIETKGRTLFEWSVRSLPLDIASKVIFICLDEHEKKYDVKVLNFEKIASKKGKKWLNTDAGKVINEFHDMFTNKIFYEIFSLTFV